MRGIISWIVDTSAPYLAPHPFGSQKSFCISMTTMAEVRGSTSSSRAFFIARCPSAPLPVRSLGAELRSVEHSLEQVTFGGHHGRIHHQCQDRQNDDPDPNEVDVHDLPRIEDHAADPVARRDKFADDRTGQRQANVNPEAA